ncbi:hypothetical protein [Acinetobacter sp.]|jgi:hypothetical protein|uniref:hypothetical protein n=1 Tax=Acinetobacter sp. TaxID=472 RepID=UPI0035B369E5
MNKALFFKGLFCSVLVQFAVLGAGLIFCRSAPCFSWMKPNTFASALIARLARVLLKKVLDLHPIKNLFHAIPK